MNHHFDILFNLLIINEYNLACRKSRSTSCNHKAIDLSIYLSSHPTSFIITKVPKQPNNHTPTLNNEHQPAFHTLQLLFLNTHSKKTKNYVK